jgi:hypothetical protein
MKCGSFPTRASVIAATLAAALAVTACGGDDSEDPEKVAIEASGGKQVTFTAPSEVKAGVAEIEFTNSGEQANDAQLIRIEGDYTEQQVFDELRKAVEGEPVADWFKGAGGVGGTEPGETNTVEQELPEGAYYVVGQNQPATPLTKIEVTSDGDSELDEPDAKVTAQEYSFTGEGLKSGTNKILLANEGAQWHHFLASRLKEGATIEDAQKFLSSQGPGAGPPPFEDGQQAVNDVQSTVLEGGTSQVVDAELQPGRYAFYCFISDKQGGPPHVVKGMVSEVTVEE